jgi:Domain of unknown function (DUF4124)
MKISSGAAWLIALLGGLALAWFLSQTKTGDAITAGEVALPGKPATERLHDDKQPTTSVQIYRWRDAKGNLNASTEPPPPGVKYTVHAYRDDQNVVPSGGGVIGN